MYEYEFMTSFLVKHCFFVVPSMKKIRNFVTFGFVGLVLFARSYFCRKISLYVFYSKLLLQFILSKLLVSICRVTVVSAVTCLKSYLLGEIVLASHEHSSSTGS